MTSLNAGYWLQRFEARLKEKRTTPEMREWYKTEIVKLKQQQSNEYPK